MDYSNSFSVLDKLVLPYGTTEDEFAEFANGHGFELADRAPEDKKMLKLLTVTYRHKKLDTLVQYILNYKINIATVRCFGVDHEAAVEMLVAHFYIVDEAEIEDCLNSSSPGDRGLGMAYLAEFASTSYEARLFKFFEAGIRDPDKDVREFANLAMAIVVWPELLPLAQEALAVETDPYLRDQVHRLVTNLSNPT